MVVTTFEPVRTKLNTAYSLSNHNDRLFGSHRISKLND